MRFSDAIIKWNGIGNVLIDCDLCGTYSRFISTDGFKDVEKDLMRELTEDDWLILDYFYALCPFCHESVRIWIK